MHHACFRLLATALLVLALTKNTFAAEKLSESSVKLGIAGPFSGPLASYGEKTKMGAQQAVDDINANGGLLGKPLEVIYADDACEPKQATAAANYLDSHDVLAVVGHFCSPTSTVAAAIYNETGTVMIEPAASDKILTENGYKNLFRTAIKADAIGTQMADAIEDKFKPKLVLILSDQLNITKQVANSFKERYKKYPEKNVKIEYFKGGEKDYMPLASKVALIRPDVIVCSCFLIEAGILVKQLKTQNITTPIVGFDTMASPEYNEIAGNVNNSYFIAYSQPEKTKETERVRAAMTQRGVGDDIFASMSYASVKIFASAVQAVGSINKNKLSEHLRNNQFDSIFGKVSFDAKGDRVSPPLSWYQWKNNKMIEIQPITTTKN